MNFWEQFALYQAQAGIHTILAKYGSDLFTPEEQATLAATGDLLTQIPMRLHDKQNPPKPPAA